MVDNKYVKLSNGKENFWAEVLYKNDSKNIIILRVDNELVNNENYDYNDVIILIDDEVIVV